ncbi:SRPBCC family protein [Agriterribacter humi]|uniref:SRPBCC family protein n=1 Tax=Agriterribacter humi TaxID=1104781 RepID=UPI001264424C
MTLHCHFVHFNCRPVYCKDYHFERSITINAPKEKVWEQVNNFTNRNKWSSWAEYDLNMQHTIEGTDGTVGVVHKWKYD